MAKLSAINDRVSFTVDVNGLNNRAQEVANKANDYRQIIKNYTILTIQLSSVWQGNAHNKFAATYQNALPVIGKLADLCDAASSAMKEYAEGVSSADQNAAARIRSCF